MNKDKTLLEQAQAVSLTKTQHNEVVTDEVMELAVAWANEDITYRQAKEALNVSSGSFYVLMARALREYVKNHVNQPCTNTQSKEK